VVSRFLNWACELETQKTSKEIQKSCAKSWGAKRRTVTSSCESGVYSVFEKSNFDGITDLKRAQYIEDTASEATKF
jgi:hypothetical protein